MTLWPFDQYEETKYWPRKKKFKLNLAVLNLNRLYQPIKKEVNILNWIITVAKQLLKFSQ